MATLQIKVTDFAPEFVKILQKGNKKAALNNISSAMDTIAMLCQETWRKYASGRMQVPGAKMIHSKGPYTRSIKVLEGGPGERIVYTDFPPHTFIESGHPEIDLKPGLLAGSSARQGKHGPYNIVSFRQDTPEASQYRRDPMPVDVYAHMLNETKRLDQQKKGALGTSKVMGKRYGGTQMGQKGWTKRSYAWGLRFDQKSKRGARVSKKGYAWKAGKWAGMVRFRGGAGYRTFRVVSWKSDPRSWIVPKEDPIPIRQAVMDFISPYVQEIIEQAITGDIS